MAAAGGYLLGSVPFGLVLTRLGGKGDIRSIGSGNIGATNVLRTGSKFLALGTLILDAGKGAFCVTVANTFGQDIAILAGGGCFLGHLFPIWLGFRGGKGVATFLGIMLSIAPLVGVLACGTWLMTALIFRYSSLAALLSAAAVPVFCYFFADWQRMELAFGMACLIFARHSKNIYRLFRRQEPRIGKKL